MNRIKKLPEGLYGITAERFSCGRSNIETAWAMVEGGITVIQYREKRPEKSFKEMLEECRQIRELTRENDVLFIVNDYPELALLSNADGVHLGQDDLPVEEVRRLVGEAMIIGLSTHSPRQAHEALKVGADYIGVGPIYRTETKEDVCDPVGLEYLSYVAANIPLPFVAIGGIKRHNITEVASRGAKTISLVTEIVGAPDIAGRVKELNSLLKE